MQMSDSLRTSAACRSSRASAPAWARASGSGPSSGSGSSRGHGYSHGSSSRQPLCSNHARRGLTNGFDGCSDSGSGPIDLSDIGVCRCPCAVGITATPRRPLLRSCVRTARGVYSRPPSCVDRPAAFAEVEGEGDASNASNGAGVGVCGMCAHCMNTDVASSTVRVANLP